MEYLIFSSDGDDAALADLQGDGLPSRRRTLARLMGEEIAQSVHELEDAWSATGGDYAGMIERAGGDSTRYRSQRAAVDDYVGGVAYALELVVGVRLAAPLGRKGTGEPDPTQDPTPRSDSSVADMSASLAGVSALYQKDGFSAQVRGRVPALDDQAKQELADCSDKVLAIPAPFAIALTEQTTLVQAAYDSCKSLKATWNVDVTSAIGATLRVGDNDGD
jgi:predicted lipoprotein